ncbi:alpha-L-arabinofuranosidase C-terminal domain-containing protein [Thermophagus sp. OGC60D27]|uniref:alpha-L-arabinofuranosidase C-terminal domain-containing protein n=1 Tax=Thermophagus sp. OGC60D27 TaxID=3458415 RepID=UPI004037DEE6
MKKILFYLIFSLTLTGNVVFGQDRLRLDVDHTVAEVTPYMWGIFFEDINFGADGGFYAELVKNRSFEFYEPMMGWKEAKKREGEGKIFILKREQQKPANPTYLRIDSRSDKGLFGVVNEGFRGMGIRADEPYYFSVLGRQVGELRPEVLVELVSSKGEVLGSTTISGFSREWGKVEGSFTSSQTDAKATLRVLVNGKGIVDMDMISLFPENTWKNRKNGLRADLVQMLYDLHPGFLRFPGGCIVEGHDLSLRYQWKKTVGPVEEREMIVNRWNTEFMHRHTPDYYQSFGLGFFEYFLLAEDIGAEPLPILNCGMACQYNTGELVPLDELDPYIQDALDLIEFANGDITTKWGKLRAEMGHPKPFNLKFLGIGNEQWGEQYVERYKIFAEVIRQKHPEIVLVGGSGPKPEDERFHYLWKEMKDEEVDLMDEHYYMSPEWFLSNADRYDDYDRNGPKVFAGEYAAHGPDNDHPMSKNTWLSALSEAAFMTGLERNADVVNMASYAPLMAHIEAWQWRPDLIWFDNLNVVGTPNYYVQKLYSTLTGSEVLNITLDGQPLTGQNKLYASASKDIKEGKIYIKLVNASDNPKEVNVSINGGAKVSRNATAYLMTADDPLAFNTFENPQKVAPVQSEIKLKGKAIKETLQPMSFYVIEIDAKF